MVWTVHNSEITKWAAEEKERILFGESDKYHAVLCDPPYLIGFMSKEWDGICSPTAGQERFRKWGEALLPLLYPGALVFMFGGTRMWHRLAAGMEDARFYLWDTLLWVHGQGFPKAQDVSKLIDKSNGDEREVVGTRTLTGNAGISTKEKGGTYSVASGLSENVDVKVTAAASEQSRPWSGHKTRALKPAWEPVLCFHAPDGDATYAELAMKYGSGALNVDGARIGTSGGCEIVPGTGGFDAGTVNALGGHLNSCRSPQVEGLGRYPANFALECTCKEVEVSSSHPHGVDYGEYGPSDYKRSAGERVKHTDPSCPAFQLDEQSGEEGGPSRFFYCAKASRSEREAGCEDGGVGALRDGGVGALRDGGRLETKVFNNHPTVKPIDLNRWLATLLLPPDSVKPRRILVPFAGVASEMIGCLVAGWDEVVGVEMSPEYCKIAEARLAHWEQFKDRPEAARLVKAESGAAQPSLFG